MEPDATLQPDAVSDRAKTYKPVEPVEIMIVQEFGCEPLTEAVMKVRDSLKVGREHKAGVRPGSVT